MVHGKIELHLDDDDRINAEALLMAGGAQFTDNLGEHRLTWSLKSIRQAIETLEKICQILKRHSEDRVSQGEEKESLFGC